MSKGYGKLNSIGKATNKGQNMQSNMLTDAEKLEQIRTITDKNLFPMFTAFALSLEANSNTTYIFMSAAYLACIGSGGVSENTTFKDFNNLL